MTKEKAENIRKFLETQKIVDGHYDSNWKAINDVMHRNDIGASSLIDEFHIISRKKRYGEDVTEEIEALKTQAGVSVNFFRDYDSFFTVTFQVA